MSPRKKCGWILVSTAALCALIIAGGKLYSAARDPFSAFEPVKNTPAPTVQARSLPGGAETPEPSAEPAPTPEPTPDPASLLGDKIAITLIGTDSNAQREEAAMGRRSDVMVVLIIDANTAKCSLLTIPRDTRAEIRRLNNNGEVTGTRTDKLNAAFAYGSKDLAAASSNVLYSLSQLLGVELTYYATIDMDAIAPLVSAVGGVTVTLPYDLEGVGEEGETVTLDGDTAYIFIRKRHGVADGSDLARTKRQQLFLKAFALRVKELGVSALPSLWASVSGEVTTNLDLSQMIALGSILSNTDTEAIETHTLPGQAKTIDGKSYFIMDEEETRELVETLF